VASPFNRPQVIGPGEITAGPHNDNWDAVEDYLGTVKVGSTGSLSANLLLHNEDSGMDQVLGPSLADVLTETPVAGSYLVIAGFDLQVTSATWEVALRVGGTEVYKEDDLISTTTSTQRVAMRVATFNGSQAVQMQARRVAGAEVRCRSRLTIFGLKAA
jgi:hypothetical protein